MGYVYKSRYTYDCHQKQFHACYMYISLEYKMIVLTLYINKYINIWSHDHDI